MNLFKKLNYLIPILAIGTLFASCNSLSSTNKHFVGDWYLSYNTDKGEQPLFDINKMQVINLLEDGKWVLGENHGKWGEGKSSENSETILYPYGLGFSESELHSKYVDQISSIDVQIIQLEGIEVIEFQVNYSYKGSGWVRTEKADVSSENVEYHSNVKYYFVKNKSDIAKIVNHFKNEDNESKLNEISKQFENNSYEIQNYLDSADLIHSIVRDFVLSDSNECSKVKNALIYASEKGALTEKQGLLLYIINNKLILSSSLDTEEGSGELPNNE
jgi:hypothetical protein